MGSRRRGRILNNGRMMPVLEYSVDRGENVSALSAVAGVPISTVNQCLALTATRKNRRACDGPVVITL